MRKASAVTALRGQRSATLRTLSRLPEASWDVPCLSAWRIRDVVAHLIAVDEAAVTGRLLPVLRAAADRHDWERWNDASVAQWSERPPDELRDALARSGERLARFVNGLPQIVSRITLRTWLGRQPLLFFVYRRVLDEWVHEHDVATASPHREGATGHPDPVLADVLAAAVLHTLPHLVLPRVGRTSGVLRLIVDTGADHRRAWGVDFARRQYGPRVSARPDAVARLDAATLALVAERRQHWQALPRTRLLIEGDEAVAADLLDALERAG